MTRMATGLGKTFSACYKGATWLARGEDYRLLVISYEKQLVWQFAQEIEEFLGFAPEIEMEEERVDWESNPKVIVASRASLLLMSAPTDAQLAKLSVYGIASVGACTSRHCEMFLKHLTAHREVREVREEIERLNGMPEVANGRWSRLHRFDWRKNWLVVWDEAHKHAHHLVSVGHIVDWFDQNPVSRRLGMTATPKRTDQVSVGDRMFPGIAIDYPLYHAVKPCALREGWAVPYVQRYIAVEGVDFRSIKKIAGDFDEAELEQVLGTESQLARLVEPLLDMVEDRRTLVFSPGIMMAASVAAYINARSLCQCSCGKRHWYATKLIGDGAMCSCGVLLDGHNIVRAEQAKSINGQTPARERKEVYRAHQSGTFQFLSVCGLCIAKGSLVLTDRGEVPIQYVTTQMRLWDGIKFVEHDGVISKGFKPVIEYAGLRATGDHNVWTANGWETLAECQQKRLAIAVAGISGLPVRESDGYYRNGGEQGQPASLGSYLRDVRPDDASPILPAPSRAFDLPRVLLSPGEPEQSESCPRVHAVNGRANVLQQASGDDGDDSQGWNVETSRLESEVHGLRERVSKAIVGIEVGPRWLQELCEVNRDTTMATVSVPCGQAALHEPVMPRLQGLRGARNQDEVCFSTGHGALDYGKHRIEETLNAGPDRKQRALRAGEFEIHDEHHPSEQSPAATEEVFDILNAGPRHRFVANGLIVSNCREGYNDPDIACVAVFRPVSKKASSLAEQMKGRASRPLRGLVDGLASAEERLAAIAKSAKPNALIVDLTGITGLADCASTVQIYADGHDDKVIQRAEKKLEDGEEQDVIIALYKARDELEEERERLRLEREEGERRLKEDAAKRAKAQAEVRYTTHEVAAKTSNPNEASPGQIKFIGFLGMELIGADLSRQRAGRIISQLKARMPVEKVAYLNGVKEEQWQVCHASDAQMNFLFYKRISTKGIRSPYDASQVISAYKDSSAWQMAKLSELRKARDHEELTGLGHDIQLAQRVLPSDIYIDLVCAGKRRRQELG